MKGPLERLIRALKKLPGVGEKTATRYAFHFLNTDIKEIDILVSALRQLKEDLKLCSICFNLTDTEVCEVCSNARRDVSRICVVETPLDLMAIEKAGYYKGLYHVLHGVLSPLDAIGPDDIKLPELISRIGQNGIAEIIIALNPTVEGEATASHIRDRLQGKSVKITRIAYGIPMGGSLEYSDPLTLSKAFENRSEL
jgi:recombination protein RecR